MAQGQQAIRPPSDLQSVQSVLPPFDQHANSHSQPIDMTSVGAAYNLIDNIPTFMKELIAGGAAGGFAKTVVAPLERTKILYQTQYATFRSLGVTQTLLFIHRREGFLGFYRGNGAGVVRIVPYAALHFMAYEQYRRLIVDNWPDWTPPGALVDLMAGSLAGGTAVLCTYPLDLVRTTLAYQVRDPTRSFQAYTGIRDVFYKVVKANGVRGLYGGIGPTLCGIVPYAGLKFFVYERLKGCLSDEQQNNVFMKLACGAAAGMVGQTFTYPLDVVRRQMQVQAVGFSNQKYKGTLDGLVAITKAHGVKQLFAGLSINYIKLVPSVAIGFAAYDIVKSWLRVPSREGSRKERTS
ncbi:hypothetical protein KP509_32G012600 [Ceratopteris richardii]|uniref:Mitochondrial carrier protein n=2 Tax=Ceratopteris richardii TaxID=49495 RepID=A0A8T2QSI4_CERRI|nr:hypothetical protein KP509_32G012600 [Ceratopteris richardii]